MLSTVAILGIIDNKSILNLLITIIYSHSISTIKKSVTYVNMIIIIKYPNS